MLSHTNIYHRLRPLPSEGNDQEISRQLLRKTSSKIWRWNPELDWLVYMTCKSNGKVHNGLSEREHPPLPPSWTLIHWCLVTAEFSRNLQIICLVSGVWSMRLWALLLPPDLSYGSYGWFRNGARRSESCVLIGFLSRQDGLILPARDFPLWPRKKSSFGHKINPWNWKQGWSADMDR